MENVKKALLIRVGHLSKSVQWSFCHLKQFIETKTGGRDTTMKNVCRPLFTMKQSSAWDVAKGRPFLCLSVTLPVSVS